MRVPSIQPVGDGLFLAEDEIIAKAGEITIRMPASSATFRATGQQLIEHADRLDRGGLHPPAFATLSFEDLSLDHLSKRSARRGRHGR